LKAKFKYFVFDIPQMEDGIDEVSAFRLISTYESAESVPSEDGIDDENTLAWRSRNVNFGNAPSEVGR